MKAEQARKLADEALEQLSAALAQGRSETLTAYLSMLSRFHDYSWGNVLLILSQKPDASKVAGFHAWRKLGRFVRKGEKGIVIIAPMRMRAKDALNRDDSAAGRRENATAQSNGSIDSRSRESDSADRSILRFKAVFVFDLSQTDGEPLPEFARVAGDPGEAITRLRSFAQAKGIAVEMAESLGGAHGRSLGGRVQILAGLTPAEEFSVLTHEIAHELLHRGERRAETTKTVRETEAEAVAFVVCQAVGLQTGNAAADYIQLYAGNAETLAASLEAIQQTAAEILAAVKPE